jgi:hypothetical protein
MLVKSFRSCPVGLCPEKAEARTGAFSERPQEVGAGEIGGQAPTPEVDLLIAPSFAFADLPLECDCHIASSA